MKQTETIKCNLCNSNDYKVIISPEIKNVDVGNIFSASGGARGTQQIVRCAKCGLMYVNPRFTEEVVLGVYENSPDEIYVSQAEGRMNTFKGNLKIINKYAKYKGRILDVGAAAGFFLKVARDDGWIVFGVEPSKWLASWGNDRYGLNIKNSTLRGAGFKSESFDVVTMWDVLEHTFDPMAELREVRRILEPGGILVINYPNIESKLAKISGKYWWFFLSVHLYYFGEKTLRRYFDALGFECVSNKRHFQKLSLGHLSKMVGLYSRGASKLSSAFIRLFKAEDLLVPYYASQANIIARKK